jgi:hypothetical protein
MMILYLPYMQVVYSGQFRIKTAAKNNSFEYESWNEDVWNP